MKKEDYRNGDVVRWRYSERELERLNHGNNGGTTYWCCSQIAVFNESKGVFEDTFWNSCDNKTFQPDDQDRVLAYVGNFDEWKRQTQTYEYLIKYYRESDIINLNHPNNSSYNLYLKKGAKKDKEVIKRNIIQKQRGYIYDKERFDIKIEDCRKLLSKLEAENIDLDKVLIP